MKFGSLIVTSHNPWRRRLLFTLIALFMIGACWSMYELGQMQGGYNKLAAIQKQLDLNAQIDKLDGENGALREQVTLLERTRVVDNESTEEMRTTIKELQDEILELREQSDFYRGIISPADRRAGLDIQSFKLTPGGEAGHYHYALVMTQVLLNERMVAGTVKMSVQGVRDGVPVTLDFKSISPNNSVEEQFQFRYFQKLEGDLRLPEGFMARAVQVEIASAGRKTLSKSFPWNIQG